MSILPRIFRLLNVRQPHLNLIIPPCFKVYSTVMRNTRLEDHLNVFLEYNFHRPTIENFLENDETWSHISLTELKNTIELLLNFNFTVRSLTTLLKNYPEICSIEKKTLADSLNAWLSFQFTFENLVDTLIQQPTFLKLDSEVILQKLPYFLLICNNKRDRCLELLKLCPDVMHADHTDIEERYMYLESKMESKPKDIAQSKALCLDINFIRTRHMFLDRAGLYEYKKRGYDKIDLTNNPTLSSILDTTDKIFAEKIARMSLLEYETFCEYFAKEIEEEENEDDNNT